MCHMFDRGVPSRTWILWTLLQLEVTLAELSSTKPKGSQWAPSTFYVNPYVVRYPLSDRNASGKAETKSSQGRSLDSYVAAVDYSRHAVYQPDIKAVPVTDAPVSSPSASPGSLFPAPSVVAATGSVSSSLQSYPYPSGSGYYYPVPQYLPPPLPQYWPPSQTFQTFDYGYPPLNGTTLLEENSDTLFVVQPSQCSNSIEVDRARDIEVRTSVSYNTTEQGVCIIMLYGANEYNKLAISVQAQPNITTATNATNATTSDKWLQTNFRAYSVQQGNITLINTKSNFGTNSTGLILTKSNIVVLSLFIDRAIDFFLDIATYQSTTC